MVRVSPIMDEDEAFMTIVLFRELFGEGEALRGLTP